MNVHNVVAIVIGHDCKGKPAVVSFPYWETEDLPGAVEQAVVTWCNTYGTGDFTVRIAEINS